MIARILFCFLLATSVRSENWPQFRGPGGTGIAENPQQLPVEWSTTKNMIWTTDLPGKGSSSPIIWGDRIFVTCFSGYGHSEENPGDKANLKRHLVCINKTDGKILWDKTVTPERDVSSYSNFIAHHGYASHTPATDGKAVFVYYAKDGAFAYDFDGNLLWRFNENIGNGTGGGFGSGGGVALFEDLVILNSSPESNACIAVNKQNGEEVWRKTDIIQSFHTPAILGDEIIIDSRDQLLGLDARTGEVKWKAAGPPAYVCNSPTVVDGIAYITHGYVGPTIAIGPGGKEIWSKNKIATTVPSPAVANGFAFIAKEDVFTVLDAKTGDIVFRDRMGVTVKNGSYASPLIVGDKVFITTRTDGTLVFSADETGKLMGQNIIEGDETLWNASPAVSEGRLYLRSEKALYCIGN